AASNRKLQAPSSSSRSRAARARESSAVKPHRRERQDARERFVVAVEMKDSGLVLMRAGCNQQDGYGNAMPALGGELTLCRARDCDRLGIRMELVEGVELCLELRKGA